jgi:hypothetical protein
MRKHGHGVFLSIILQFLRGKSRKYLVQQTRLSELVEQLLQGQQLLPGFFQANRRQSHT